MRENVEEMSVDYLLVLSTLLLVAIGLVSVYSASSIISGHYYGDSFLFLKHQAVHVFIGIVALMIVSRIPYHLYRAITYPFLFLCLIGLVLVLIPGIGRKIHGAMRWIRVGPFNLQVSEFAKLALIIYLSYSLEKKMDKIKSFSIGFLPHILVGGLLAALVLLEPDLGTALSFMCLVFLLLFIAGARITYLTGAVLAGLPFLYFLIWNVPYRLERILGFINPWADPYKRGYHLVHSLMALSNGGFWGVGLGKSYQKLFYLPEPHTDFILAVIAEELGLFGVIAIVILFGIILWRGILIARNAPDLFGIYLASGIITMICLQAVINMGVVTGLLPTKGLPLPFVSYGGSSLLVSLIGIGIVLNVGRSALEAAQD